MGCVSVRELALLGLPHGVCAKAQTALHAAAPAVVRAQGCGAQPSARQGMPTAAWPPKRAGANAAILHYETNRCKVGPRDLVLIDAGAEVRCGGCGGGGRGGTREGESLGLWRK